MGNYTGLRVKVFVKKEYREMIAEINEEAEWGDFADEFPFLKEYSKLYRSEFIPRGAIAAYLPDDWQEAITAFRISTYPMYIATDGFHREIDMDTGYWTFQCSLKNYENEIEKFFEDVLSKIIDSSEHIEYLYEEWEESLMYEFVDGKIVQIKQLKQLQATESNKSLVLKER